MLEGTTNRDRIISAALRLAETRGWRDLSLGEIAAEAGVPLAEFRKEFQSKAQILAAFSRAIDMAVIEKFPAPGPDVARDRLFDVLLTRFEVMQPYKAAIRRIREDVGSSLADRLDRCGPRSNRNIGCWPRPASAGRAEQVYCVYRGFCRSTRAYSPSGWKTTTPAWRERWRLWTAGCGVASR